MARAPSAAALAWGAFALMTLVWGSTFLAIRVSNAAGYDPFSAAAVRLLLAAALLGIAWRALGLPRPGRRGLAVSLGGGALMFGVNFGLLYWGELSVPSATAAVLWGIYPALVALGAGVFLASSEPLGTRSLGGALVAALGLAVVFRSQLGLDAPAVGFAAVLGGITAAAVASLMVKKWGKDVHPLAYNALGNAAGAALLVPVAFALGDGLALPPTPDAWMAFVFLLVAGSLVAFNLWAWLVVRWPVTRLSYQTVLSPLVAVVLGALLLAEPAGPDFLAGTGLVLAGTWVAVKPAPPGRRRRPQPQGAAPPAEAGEKPAPAPEE